MDDIDITQLIIEQLEMSRDLLSGGLKSFGSSPYLNIRSALLFIDNVVEMLMFNFLVDFLKLNGLRNAIDNDSLSKLINHETKPETELEDNSLRKGGKLWSFPAKVDYLILKKIIPANIGEIMKNIHEHRNTIYHANELYLEVIYPLTILYFKIACDLVFSLRGDQLHIRIKNKTFLKDFLKRYSLEDKEFVKENDLADIISKLKNSIIIDVKNVKKFILKQYKFRSRRLKIARRRVMKSVLIYKKRILATPFKKELKGNDVKNLFSKAWERKHEGYVREFLKLNLISDEINLLYSFLNLEKNITLFENKSATTIDKLVTTISLSKELTQFSYLYRKKNK